MRENCWVEHYSCGNTTRCASFRRQPPVDSFKRDWNDSEQHLCWTLPRWSTVLFSDESRFQLYHADGRLRVWRCVGESYTDANVLRQVAHGGASAMVWADICYGQRTHLHFIDGNLNGQRNRDEIKLLCPLLNSII